VRAGDDYGRWLEIPKESWPANRPGGASGAGERSRADATAGVVACGGRCAGYDRGLRHRFRVGPPATAYSGGADLGEPVNRGAGNAHARHHAATVSLNRSLRRGDPSRRNCGVRGRDLELQPAPFWNLFPPWRRPLVDREPRPGRSRRLLRNRGGRTGNPGSANREVDLKKGL
jgi:hypothetical protein